MALTVSEFATGSTTTSATSITISSLTAAVGDMLVVAVSSDNSVFPGSTPIGSSAVSDSASNTYTSRVNQTNDPGNANEGVSLRVFTGTLTNALSNGSITVTLTASTSNVDILVWRIQCDAGETISYVTATGGTATGTSVSRTIGSLEPGSVAFGFAATETGGTFTGDSDTLEGSWSSEYQSIASNTPVFSQYKIVDGTSTQTWTASWVNSADSASGTITIAMQKKATLYLPSSSSTPAISPSVDSGWEKSSDLDRLLATTTKGSTALTSITSIKDVSNTAYDIVRRQYIYGPLAAQTIQGSVVAWVRTSQSSTNADASSQISIRVVSNDGNTVRGTALALSNSALSNEWSTSLTSRAFPLGVNPTVMTPVEAQAGDYLVMEFGVRGREASTNSRTFTWNFGDAATSNIPVAGSQTANNPVAIFYGTSLALTTLCTPGTASLTLTGYAPTVTKTDNKTATLGTASLTLTAYAPTVTATDNKTVSPDPASLALTAYAPTVTVTDNKTATPETASLSLTAYAPTVDVQPTSVTVTPGTASLSLTAYAPTVTATVDGTVAPAPASLTLTAYAPTVTATDNKTITPGTASLTLTTAAPVLTEVVTPATASLSLTTYEIDVSADEVDVVGTATLTLTLYAPVVTRTENVVCVIGKAQLALTAFPLKIRFPTKFNTQPGVGRFTPTPSGSGNISMRNTGTGRFNSPNQGVGH